MRKRREIRKTVRKPKNADSNTRSEGLFWSVFGGVGFEKKNPRKQERKLADQWF